MAGSTKDKKRKTKCKCQFVLIEERAKASHPDMVRNDILGAQCGCPLCGEIRTVWGDGEIEINVKGK